MLERHVAVLPGPSGHAIRLQHVEGEAHHARGERRVVQLQLAANSGLLEQAQLGAAAHAAPCLLAARHRARGFEADAASQQVVPRAGVARLLLRLLLLVAHVRDDIRRSGRLCELEMQLHLPPLLGRRRQAPGRQRHHGLSGLGVLSRRRHRQRGWPRAERRQRQRGPQRGRRLEHVGAGPWQRAVLILDQHWQRVDSRELAARRRIEELHLRARSVMRAFWDRLAVGQRAVEELWLVRGGGESADLVVQLLLARACVAIICLVPHDAREVAVGVRLLVVLERELRPLEVGDVKVLDIAADGVEVDEDSQSERPQRGARQVEERVVTGRHEPRLKQRLLAAQLPGRALLLAEAREVARAVSGEAHSPVPARGVGRRDEACACAVTLDWRYQADHSPHQAAGAVTLLVPTATCDSLSDRVAVS